MKRLALLLLIVVVLVAAGAALWVTRQVSAPFGGFSGEQFVEIPPGESTDRHRPSTGGRGCDPRRTHVPARDALARSWPFPQGGRVPFHRGRITGRVIDRLAKGDVYLLPLTFPEGLTAEEMSQLFAQSGLGTARDFMEAVRDPEPIKAIDPAADTLEGYLFPDTYSLPRRIDGEAMVARMVKRFTTVFDEDLRRRATTTGLSVRQIMAIAALVEKETARGEERPLVAAVYRNRFKIGMPMQADPTVIYALKRAGRWNGNIRKADLDFDSPYNTYRYPGLPPGPIASPGKAAIEATIAPAKVDYLYFVSRNDGSHAFAATLPEHNRNVQKWQVEYFRERRTSNAER